MADLPDAVGQFAKTPVNVYGAFRMRGLTRIFHPFVDFVLNLFVKCSGQCAMVKCVAMKFILIAEMLCRGVWIKWVMSAARFQVLKGMALSLHLRMGLAIEPPAMKARAVSERNSCASIGDQLFEHVFGGV